MSFREITYYDAPDIYKIYREVWYHEETKQFHRDDGPACIRYDRLGNVFEEVWYNHGKISREDGPSIVEYYSSGNIHRQFWYSNQVLDRSFDLPAFICYEPNGKIFGQEWYRLGKIHRDGDRPAKITEWNGREREEIWYQDGKIHRDNDLPAVIGTRNGNLLYRRWYLQGKLDRNGDQPSMIDYDLITNTEVRRWIQNDQPQKKEIWISQNTLLASYHFLGGKWKKVFQTFQTPIKIECDICYREFELKYSYTENGHVSSNWCQICESLISKN